ncbi:MAG: formamidopyrimidine-DNA glycosylase, partial [Acidimicrobiia bacterium]|nr:formamidopyrimidine-DNA glycosylase [Acidimicrobiia bacterium]
MPEGVEIEIYRRSAAEVVGRMIEAVEAPDPWFLKDGLTANAVTEAVTGQVVEAARRKGKLLVLDLSNEIRLGLRFGMTGRLIVDQVSSIEYLEYASQRHNPEWDRFVLRFAGGGDLRIQDPRRLGGVQLDPDEDTLGADVFTATLGDLRARVFVGDVPIKARLLDQTRLAGVGNLIADETLFRAGIDPARPASSLDQSEQRKLQRHLRKVVGDFLRDGGSHTGRLQPSRVRGGRCPKDGAELLRREVGGRT